MLFYAHLTHFHKTSNITVIIPFNIEKSQHYSKSYTTMNITTQIYRTSNKWLCNACFSFYTIFR